MQMLKTYLMNEKKNHLTLDFFFFKLEIILIDDFQ